MTFVGEVVDISGGEIPKMRNNDIVEEHLKRGQTKERMKKVVYKKG